MTNIQERSNLILKKRIFRLYYGFSIQRNELTSRIKISYGYYRRFQVINVY